MLSANAEDRLAANSGSASARIGGKPHEVLVDTAELVALLPMFVLIAKVLDAAICTTVLALLLGLLRLLDNNNHESPVRAELPYGILMMISSLFDVAPTQGFEPQSTESESAVLPLNEAGVFGLCSRI